jgi:peptidoglycan/LPS O-acetylase OafA/YrhL
MMAIRDIYYPTYTRLDGLLVGVVIASIFNYRPILKDKLMKSGNILLALSMILLVLSYIMFDGSIISPTFTSLTTAVFGFPIISIAYGLMLIAAMSPKCILSRYRLMPSALLATLAYAIYLSHKIIYHLVNTHLKPILNMNSYEIFLICLVAATICGYALHLGVEKPFLILSNKIAGYRKQNITHI